MNAYRFLLIVLIICLTEMSAKSQDSTTIYLDQFWNKITESESYTYYRVEKVRDSLIDVNEYYKSGVLKVKGTRSALYNSDYWEGDLSYFNEEGNLSHQFYYVNNEKSGTMYTYFGEGMKQSVQHYERGKKDGADSFFYKSGQLSAIVTYKKGEMNGEAKRWFQDGSVEFTEFFKEDAKEGVQQYFFENGQLRREEKYKDSIRTYAQCYDSTGKEISFYERSLNPEFEGKFTSFLIKNIKYPQSARNQAIEGKVWVNFVVAQDGTVKDVKVIHKTNRDLALEAIRVIKASSGKWKPGMIEGEVKDFSMRQPVLFALE